MKLIQAARRAVAEIRAGSSEDAAIALVTLVERAQPRPAAEHACHSCCGSQPGEPKKKTNKSAQRRAASREYQRKRRGGPGAKEKQLGYVRKYRGGAKYKATVKRRKEQIIADGKCVNCLEPRGGASGTRCQACKDRWNARARDARAVIAQAKRQSAFEAMAHEAVAVEAESGRLVVRLRGGDSISVRNNCLPQAIRNAGATSMAKIEDGGSTLRWPGGVTLAVAELIREHGSEKSRSKA